MSTTPPADHPAVTDDDLAVLRGDPLFRPPPVSGYFGVYRKAPGSGVWQARPYSSGGGYRPGQGGCAGRKGRGGPRVLVGNFRSPREAAKAVVRWWKAQYGEDWVAAFRTRTVNPWFARRAAGGWQLVVRPPGGAERVVPPPDGAALFPDRESAAAYFRVWAEREFRGAAWRALRAG